MTVKTFLLIGRYILLTASLVGMTIAAQGQIKGSVNPMSTTLSKEQGEAIPGPFPTRDALPKRISLDALTKEEIDRYRQEIYSAPYGVRPQGIGGSPDCMQWVFKREGKSGPIQPVGFSISGDTSAIKINGTLRSIDLSVYRASDLAPIKLLSLNVWSFKLISGPLDLIKNRELPLEDYDKWRLDENRILGRLSITFQGLLVETPKMQCTYLNANCRRYIAPLQSVNWLFHPELPRNVSGHQGEPVPIALPYEVDLLIEDMCPYHHDALVEKSINTRVTGERVAIKKYGFPKNPKLMEALKPFVKP